ncbi:MAG: hypothetical protein RI907_3280 [Pseudomonadota bacterium]
MDPGFELLFCVTVVDAAPMSLGELKAKYAKGLSLSERLKSIQGVKYVYRAAMCLKMK